MKKILIIVFLFSLLNSYTQNIGIGTNNPHASAKLDIQASNMGILIPQVNLSTVVFPSPGPATGLLVWNNSASFGSGIGFYYNFGSTGTPSWLKIADSSSVNDADADPNNENQTVSAGTGISVSQTGQDFEVTNSSPDQTVSITGAGGTTVTGTYPNFTVTSTDNVNDADADPNNEIQNLSSTSSGTNRTINISGGTGTTISVADNDNSSSNEIQTLSISGSTVSLSNGGGNVTVPGDNLGNHTATANLNMTDHEVDNITFLDMKSGNGNGLRFWSSNSYKFHMGNTSEFKYGAITDYSIKTNMNDNSARGWTWGVSGATPVASISTKGHTTLKGALFLDCLDCGSTTTAYPTSGASWGDMVIQGRVLSTNSNLHLSPPGGFNVIINDTYRSAGGTNTGSAGLQIESLAGAGERPVYVDALGVLKEGRPKGYVTSFSSNMRHSPDDVGGTTLDGDDVSIDHTLPFTFHIGGVDYTQIRVCSNGWVTFGTNSSTNLSNTALPTSDFAQPLIAAYWDDLVTKGQHIEIEEGGSVGGRVVTIKAECETFSGSNDINYEIMIHEKGMITVSYWGAISPAAIGQGATIGFQMAGGSSANAFPITYNEEVIDDNDERQSWSVYIPQDN